MKNDAFFSKKKTKLWPEVPTIIPYKGTYMTEQTLSSLGPAKYELGLLRWIIFNLINRWDERGSRTSICPEKSQSFPRANISIFFH